MEVYLAGLGALIWQLDGCLGKMSFNARTIHFAGGCWNIIGRIQHCMKMSGRSKRMSIAEGSMFSPADFPASLSAVRDDERERQMTVISGRKCIESLERFGRVGSLAKMFSVCLIGEAVWFSSRCRLTWKLKATRSGRMYCQLQVSERRTGGTGFGLLPTPTAMMNEESVETFEARKKRLGRKSISPNLHKRLNLMIRSSGVFGIGPEPGKNFRLSHRFILEMMGFPPDWTELPFQNGEMDR